MGETLLPQESLEELLDRDVSSSMVPRKSDAFTHRPVGSSAPSDFEPRDLESLALRNSQVPICSVWFTTTEGSGYSDNAEEPDKASPSACRPLGGTERVCVRVRRRAPGSPEESFSFLNQRHSLEPHALSK